MRAWVLAAVLVAAIPRIADLARAPNIVSTTYALRDGAARDAVAMLGLGDGTTTLEQSQSDELRARPDRDAALRGSDGLLTSELGWRTSTVIRATATWRDGVLTFAGSAADRATSFPHDAGPQFSIASPAFGAIDEVPGWRVVYARLAALPDAKHRELAAGGVVATLDRWDTFDMNNRAVVKWVIAIAFGPPIEALHPSVDEAPPKRGGCS